MVVCRLLGLANATHEPRGQRATICEGERGGEALVAVGDGVVGARGACFSDLDLGDSGGCDCGVAWEKVLGRRGYEGS